MNPYFTKEEATAIISAVIDTVCVDGQLDQYEKLYVARLAKKFNLSEQDIRSAQLLTPDQVSAVLSKMTYEKRKLTTCFLNCAATADGIVRRVESTILRMMINRCNLPELGDNHMDMAIRVTEWLNS